MLGEHGFGISKYELVSCLYPYPVIIDIQDVVVIYLQ